MADSSWGPGWPNCQEEKWVVIGTVPGVNPAVFDVARVHRDVHELVRLLIAESARRGYTFLDGQCWGAVCRSIRGSNLPSNHSWGLALDFNSARNPLGSDPEDSDVPKWMVALWAEYGFRWGGFFQSRPDPMHFEFMGSTTDALVLTEKARRELGNKEEDMRLDQFIEGQELCLARAKERGGDPGPPPAAMEDPDRRKGWVLMRAALINPK